MSERGRTGCWIATRGIGARSCMTPKQTQAYSSRSLQSRRHCRERPTRVPTMEEKSHEKRDSEIERKEEKRENNESLHVVLVCVCALRCVYEGGGAIECWSSMSAEAASLSFEVESR